MKLGIMQPYFFPYIGYFHLIKAVDKFVIYDDVNYIKGGWINRNRILLKNEAAFINIPILGSSSFKKINEIEIGKDLNGVLKKIHFAYSKAPYFKKVFPFISDLILYNSNSLSLHLANSIWEISNYFRLDTKFVLSSEINKDNSLKGQDKIISICKLEKASTYCNAIGGISLYSKNDFKDYFIDLKFIKSGNIEYMQFGADFIANLSIIDVMMFNDRERIVEYLSDYELV
jgi:hypothetical protein